MNSQATAILLALIWLAPQACSSSTSQTTSNTTDRLALLRFKSVLFDPLGALNSWNDTVHFCNWYGVTCSKRNPDRVTILYLPQLELQGPISPSISNLTFLHKLYLNLNNFHGHIPDELFRMPRLSLLVLSANYLDGEIPKSFTNSTSIREVGFTNNLLTGEIPQNLGSLSQLLNLNMGMNSFTGTIPVSICNISSLYGFVVRQNYLQGSIPDCIGRLTNLNTFQAYNNSLSGSLPLSLYNITSLQQLTLANNKLSGSLPPDMFDTLPNLKLLYLSGNQFHGSLPVSLSNCTSMEDLELTDNRFSGTVPPGLGGMQQLWWFEVSSNQLEARKASDWDFLISLTNCSKLQLLDLSDNLLGGILPESISNLAPILDILSIGMNQISGTIPAGIGNLFNLTIFALNDNNLTGGIPSTISKLQRLHVLSLSGNGLSGDIPYSIGNLTQLNSLYLQENNITGSIPASLGNCKSLQTIDISQNKLSGAVPKELLILPSLSIVLNLSRNLLSGPLPLQISNLKNLGRLDLSNNRLSGEVPSGIGDCQSLEKLFMQGNSFSGPIPQALSNLKGLEVLDLSRNNLSGNIPESFETLRALQSLNLSFNDLEGQVPYEGIFKNITSVSLEGNKKLCGGITRLKLVSCSSTASTIKKHKSRVHLIIIPVLCAVFIIISLATFVILYWIKRSKKKLSFRSPFDDRFLKVSYNELLKATDGFSSSNLIGMGSFSSVYEAKLVGIEDIVAVKVLNLKIKGASRSFMAECAALAHIRHRNLVRVITSCSSVDFNGNDFKALVLQYMPNGSLERWLHANKPLTVCQRLNIAVDVACAIEYLHHDNLKPSNVLIDENMVAHVNDFGLARFLHNTDIKSREETTGLRGTIGYVPPEYGMGAQATTHGDVYSYGILLLELFTGKRPTDEMFQEGLNLSSYVELAIPQRSLDVADTKMFLLDSNATPRTDLDDEDVTIEDKLKCLNSVFRIGVSCTREDPRARMDMQDVVKEITALRDKFLKDKVHEERQEVVSIM